MELAPTVRRSLHYLSLEGALANVFELSTRLSPDLMHKKVLERPVLCAVPSRAFLKLSTEDPPRDLLLPHAHLL